MSLDVDSWSVQKVIRKNGTDYERIDYELIETALEEKDIKAYIALRQLVLLREIREELENIGDAIRAD